MNINKISLIGFLLFCNALFLSAQVDSKYLAGAVVEENGRVSLKRDVKVSSEVSKSQLFDLVDAWMKEEFAEAEESSQRVLLSDKANDYVVAQGDEKLVFKSQVLSLDQTNINYQLVARVESGKCNLEMRTIRYDYSDYKQTMPAEKMITDKMALNKSGDKLNRHYDKFRTFTIDRMDALKNSLSSYLGKVSLEEAKAIQVKETSILAEEKETAPVVIPATPLVPATRVGEMVGYKQLKADQLSDAILKMIKDSRAVAVASADDEQLALTATWSGMGNFGGKQSAMAFVNTDGHKLGSDATLTISFLTEIHADALDNLEKTAITKRLPAEGLSAVKTDAGNTAFNEAWMVIECKLTMEQDSSESAVKENAQSKMWKNNTNTRMVMGEILNIWVR